MITYLPFEAIPESCGLPHHDATGINMLVLDLGEAYEIICKYDIINKLILSLQNEYIVYILYDYSVAFCVHL